MWRKLLLSQKKLKRIAEEAAEEADAIAKRKAKVDTEQSIEDEHTAFEAELEEELGAETDTVDWWQSVEGDIAAFAAELAAELGQ